MVKGPRLIADIEPKLKKRLFRAARYRKHADAKKAVMEKLDAFEAASVAV
jgi:hypothetical protein